MMPTLPTAPSVRAMTAAAVTIDPVR